MAIGFKMGNININTNNPIKIKSDKTTTNTLTGFSNTDTNNSATLYFYQVVGYSTSDSDCLTSINNSSATYNSVNSRSAINYTAINIPIISGHVKRIHYTKTETNSPITINYGWTANNINNVIIIIQTGSTLLSGQDSQNPVYQISNKTATGCTLNFNFWSTPNWNRAVDVQIIELP